MRESQRAIVVRHIVAAVSLREKQSGIRYALQGAMNVIWLITNRRHCQCQLPFLPKVTRERRSGRHYPPRHPRLEPGLRESIFERLSGYRA